MAGPVRPQGSTWWTTAVDGLYAETFEGEEALFFLMVLGEAGSVGQALSEARDSQGRMGRSMLVIPQVLARKWVLGRPRVCHCAR